VTGVGLDGSVGIATHYGLVGPGIETRGGTRFSARVQTGPGPRPSLLYIGSFPGVKRPGRDVDHPPHLALRLEKEYSYTSTPLWVFVACSRLLFTFTLDRQCAVLSVTVVLTSLECRPFRYCFSAESGFREHLEERNFYIDVVAAVFMAETKEY
jgi:hypothetical protein